MHPVKVPSIPKAGGVAPSCDDSEGEFGVHWGDRVVRDQHGGESGEMDEVVVDGPAGARSDVVGVHEPVEISVLRVDPVQIGKRDGQDGILVDGSIEGDLHDVVENLTKVVADEPRPVETVESLDEVAIGEAMSTPELLDQYGLMITSVQGLLHERSGKDLLHGYYTN